MAATEPADGWPGNVSWYGSGRRDIEVVTATGNWYHSGEGLVPLRWVFVRDRTGTHRDDYLFSTDPEMAAARWSRRTPVVGRSRPPSKNCVTRTGDDARMEEATVLRPVPCLLGCSRWSRRCTTCCRWARARSRVEWPGKVETTFPDAITAAGVGCG